MTEKLTMQWRPLQKRIRVDWSTDPRTAKAELYLTSSIRIAAFIWITLLGALQPCFAATPEPKPPQNTSNKLPLTVHWTGTKHCAAEANLREHLRRLLGKDFTLPSDAPVDVKAQILQVSGGLRLSLSVTGSQDTPPRIIDASDCEELAQAGALVLSVWLQERAVATSLKTQDSPESTIPIVVNHTAGAPLQESADWVFLSRVRLEKSHFAVTPRRTAEFAFGGGPILAFGLLPKTSGGVLGHLGLTVQNLRLQVKGLWLMEQSTWKANPVRLGGRFSLLAAGLQLGRVFDVFPQVITVNPAFWSMLGRMQAKGLGLDKTTLSRGAWGAAGLSSTLSVQTRRIAIGLELAAGLPFGRPRFLVDEIQLFQPPRVLGWTHLLFTLRLS